MKINIHLGDSLKAMESMPANKYGLAIVDPPYGINVNMNIGIKKGKRGIYKNKEWDKSSPPDSYFNNLFIVCNDSVIWGANNFKLPTSQYFAVWDKGETMYGRDFAEAELAYVSSGGTRIFKKSPIQANRIHPTSKPVALYKWLLKNYAFNKDGSKRTIFDSHGGSMSIVIACIDLGFDIDIWEIDEDYYTDAVNRIKRHLAQQDLTRELVEINYFN